MITAVKSRLSLYFIAHLNLMYSSIHEDDHALVIKNCYSPLLDICERLNFPAGIELSGYTLERISRIDGLWIEKFKDLHVRGLIELLGSGYAQIIGPLVPQEVNRKNLEAGSEVYESLLGIRPKLAYINEQAVSSGILDVYIDAGFEALIMEWNNVFAVNSGRWNSDWQYYPQYAISATNRRIPVIWNNVISFQRLQRFVHGEITAENYDSYLKSHVISDCSRFLCMYGNDLEVFDYRPGRYKTEAEISNTSDWKRLEELIRRISSQDMYSFILPSKILEVHSENAFHDLHLTSSATPIPVKKQSKYNITRWALSGRNDVRNNASCFRIYEMLNELITLSEHSNLYLKDYWKELCYLWGSDFRTHITDEKYADYLKRMAILEYKLSSELSRYRVSSHSRAGYSERITAGDEHDLLITSDGWFFSAENDILKIVLNGRRGMAIDSLIFKKTSDVPVIGTLHQGFFSDISWGVDLYSGHVIVQPIRDIKITDLEPVEIKYNSDDVADLSDDRYVSGLTVFSCSIKTPIGVMHKVLYIYSDRPRIDLEYVFEWNRLREASFRAGILTFHPDCFNRKSLYYKTHNGGPEELRFLSGYDFSHADPVTNSLITASHCIGATDGIMKVGDKDKELVIKTSRYPVAALPMLEFHEIDDKFLLRLYYSLGEHDETSCWCWNGRTKWSLSIELDS